ncbi:Outer membrane stress sensor protease DegS [hydrothermal vent metagenome]|uniref:Outer membrane stress sensor protease DegS n=1 Tax=hydrothermal vent metagenome TaxID=652676 RepID=A0A3B1BMZ1_9ZZZZ
MRITKTIKFIFRFITIGLALAFVLLFMFPALRPDLNSQQAQAKKPVVEFRQSSVRQPSNTGPVSYADAVERAAPAVVNIYTRKVITESNLPSANDPIFRYFFGQKPPRPHQRTVSSLGSGVIVSPQGYILTNNHVIAAADEIQVALQDGQTTQAKLVGADPETDLAVLKIKLKNLPAITLGNAKALRVGDVVLAIGNPFGVGQTVTSGIISATGRNMLGINTFENFIQTDAAINPGNSGGALITAHGELIGINTAIFSKSGGSQGIGFAIPMSLAKDVMTQIIEHGEVVRGWLGVVIQDLSPELARSFGLKNSSGVILSNIMVNGPADKGGLAVGDIITRINNEKINDVKQALKLISKIKPGSKVYLRGVRQGKNFEITAVVGTRPHEGSRAE